MSYAARYMRDMLRAAPRPTRTPGDVRTVASREPVPTLPYPTYPYPYPPTPAPVLSRGAVIFASRCIWLAG